MTSVLTYFLLTVVMFVALALLQCSSLKFMIILSSLFSLFMAMLFTVMQAPDVSLTEALVGGGMTTIMFLGTSTGIQALFRSTLKSSITKSSTAQFSQISSPGDSNSEFYISQKQSLAENIQINQYTNNVNWRSRIVFLGVVSILILLVVLLLHLLVQNLPITGLFDSTGVHKFASKYILQTVQYTTFHNVVNAIVVSQRGFDTLVELYVILTASLSIMLLLNTGNLTGRLFITKNKIAYHTITLLIPIMLLFSCYLFTRGEYAPGGGFQAGILLSITISVYTLIYGIANFIKIYSVNFMIIALMSGVLFYLGSNLLPVVFNAGVFAETGKLPSLINKIAGIVSELGIMLVVSVTMILMFHSLVVHFRK